MSVLWKLAKLTVALVIAAALLATLAAGAAYVYVYRDLPKLESIKDYHPLVVSEVFDKDGKKVGEFWKERRIILPYKAIPKKMIHAMIASEDNRFFEHSGIDYLGIMRAMVENFRAGHVVQGGSTITQQIVKSLLLTPERSYSRKLKEAILAKRIEENFSKEEILYLYLTQTYFGNRAYGIEAAAENYFHKTLKEANLAELAMLAGLPKAPSKFSPLTNAERAVERQWYVLDRMVEDGYATQAEATQAKSAPLTIYTAGIDQDTNNQFAPWFTEHVRRQIKEKYGDEVLYGSGLKIYTTLDSVKGTIADEAVKRGVRALDKRQGYKGPLARVAEADIAKSCAQVAEEGFRAGNPPLILKSVQNPASGAIQVLRSTPPYTLETGKLYKAIITRVDAKKKELEICHGDKSGVIAHAGYKWARPRNLANPGWEDADYVPDAAARFKVGDVVEVALKLAPPADDKSAAGNEPGTSSFTLEQNPEVEGSLFSYDPATGYVVAMVGGYDFKEKEFNRAVQALRQPGSSFKPFVYTSALLKGYKPDTIVYDSPITFEWGPGKFWSPKNYGGKYSGAIPLAKALAHSLNTVAVRLIVDVGTDFVAGLARTLGLTTPIDRYYPMALGSSDVHLMEISRAYGSFATGGILPTLIFTHRIEDRDGRLVEENKIPDIAPLTSYFSAYPPSDEQVAPPQTPAESAQEPDFSDAVPSYYYTQDVEDLGEEKYFNAELHKKGLDVMAKEGLDLRPFEQALLFGREIPPGYTLNPRVAVTMRDLLMGVVDHGTAVRAKALKRPAAGKTGTTNNQTDAWFIGFVPQLVTGTWIGFDSRQSIGEKETGGKAALPIWMEYMDRSLSGQEALPFVTPPQALSSFYDPAHIKAVFLASIRGEAPPLFEETDPTGDQTSPFVGDVSTDMSLPNANPGASAKSPSQVPNPGPTADDNFFSSDF